MCSLLAVLCGCITAPADKKKSAVIVKNKRSDYSIVIPAAGDPEVRKYLRAAALDLQQVICESTGLRIPVVNEKICCGRPECTNVKKGIYIGRCHTSVQAGIFKKLRGKSSFAVVENSGNIFLAGVDTPGALRQNKCFRNPAGSAGAAAYFMKRFLKTEIFFPGIPGRNTPKNEQLSIPEGYSHTGELRHRCFDAEKIHKVFCGIGREGENFGSGFAGPICNIMCRNESVSKESLQKYCRKVFMESASEMVNFYRLLYSRCQKFPADCRRHRGKKSLATDPERLAAIFTPETVSRLERFLSGAEKKSVSRRVKQRIFMVRNEFNYSKNLAAIIHMHRAYRLSSDRAGFGKVVYEVEKYRRLYNSWFDSRGGRKPLPGWPEVMLCGQSSRKALAPSGLAQAIEPFRWDIPALQRKGILPGVPVKKAAKAPRKK